MNIFRTVLLVLLCTALAGCASSRSGKVYSRNQARSAQTIELGTVIQVEQVLIEGTKSRAGTLAGGVTGGALGNTVGSGGGRTVATAVGAVIGGLAGSAVEEGVTRKAGFEITVDMDNGPAMVIVQEADEAFLVGDRVRIIQGPDGTTRVRH